MEPGLRDFILKHSDDDISALLLAQSRYPGIDVRKAASIIEARRRIATKLPLWYSNIEMEYPNALSLEQCSSEATALYKQRFVPEGGTLADITGGLGVDCHYMSRKALSAVYIERNPELCRAAEHNFTILGDENISVVNSDHLENCARFDLIYADPARRSANASRLYSISDCEPDIIALKASLLSVSDALLVKISPMADISRTLEQIPECSEVHVVSVDNECKELLLYMRSLPAAGGCRIVCINISSSGEDTFEFSLSEESVAQVTYASSLGRFLYQPNRSVLKAGAFRLVSERFDLRKLAPSTHLYTSDSLIPSFPGRIMEIESVLDWNKKAIAELKGLYGAIEMTAVNFPLDTNSLRQRVGIPDGGSRHLFATTFAGRKVAIVTRSFHQRA